MRTQATATSFEDGERGPQAIECRQHLELKKEMYSPLVPPDKSTPYLPLEGRGPLLRTLTKRLNYRIIGYYICVN